MKTKEDIWDQWVEVVGENKVVCKYCNGYKIERHATRCKQHTSSCTAAPLRIRDKYGTRLQELNSQKREKFNAQFRLLQESSYDQFQGDMGLADELLESSDVVAATSTNVATSSTTSSPKSYPRAVSAAPGSPVGFLGRITTLEREVNFLKQKVEDDARWKHVLERWILDNFAFDIRGSLLNRDRGDNQHDNISRDNNKKTKSSTNYHTPSTSKSNTQDRVKRSINIKTYTEESEEEFYDESQPEDIQLFEDDGEGGQSNYENDESDNGLEVSVDPCDLIITPDSCSDRKLARTKKEITFDTSTGRTENEPSSEVEYQGDSSSNSSSDSEDDEDLKPKTYRRFQWTLLGTYPNLETLKKSFNMREWALSTTQRSPAITKIYYYCKECRKNGPGRLQICYKTEDSEVEVYKNDLPHDHSRKVRMSEEMKEEVLSLYKAGMKNSAQIMNAVKISKPDLRLPSCKQICNALKTYRMKERKEKNIQIKKEAKAKKKLKKGKVVEIIKGGEETVQQIQQVTTNANLSAMHMQSAIANCGQFQGSHIVSVSGFSPSIQQFTSAVYAQPMQQQHSGGYDPNTTTLQLHPHNFHTI